MRESDIYELCENIKNMGFNIDSIKFKSRDTEIFCGNNSIINIHSCAKTFTSIALGIAKDYYSLNLNEPIINFFPEYIESAYAGTERIRIIDLLHMQSGKKLQSLLQDSGNKAWNSDWLAWFFESTLDYMPATHFYYSSHCCYVVGRLIERLSGKDLNLFLNENLWEPLGIKMPYWSKCPKGFTNCAGNLMLSCMDLAKFGELLLTRGKHKNQTICPVNYIDLMTNDIVESNDPFEWNDIECNQGYGLFIWKCSYPNTYCAWGAGGTFCIINYSKECAITITSKRDDVNWKKYNDHRILTEVNKFFEKL